MTLILTQQETPQIGVLTLNRPEKRNALNIELMSGFVEKLEKLINVPSQRVIILKGNGPVFCAGLDLEEAKYAAKAKTSAQLVAKIISLLHSCPLVTIAMVQGAALAGGAGLMCACDFTVADKEALFGLPETRRGLVAALIMTLLVSKLRQNDLKELLLTGEIISAEKALSMGLINRMVQDQESLLPEALSLADLIIQGAPEATKLTKLLLNEFSERTFAEDMKRAMVVHEQVRQSLELQEGIKAFLEKRPPSWVYP